MMIDRIQGFIGTTLAILLLSALSAAAISLLLGLLFGGSGQEYWVPVGWVVAAIYGAAFQQRLVELVGDE